MEIDDKANVCVLRPYSIVMNPNSEGIGDLFLYANHQIIEATEHSNYVVDFVREKFFLRFLRTFDNENVCWKIVFFGLTRRQANKILARLWIFASRVRQPSKTQRLWGSEPQVRNGQRGCP